MANTTDPFAVSVHGTNPQYLVEKITRTKIYNSLYWKEHCFGLTAEGIVEKAVDLTYVAGSYGGNNKPSKFLCLVLKMLQLQPEKDIIIEFIKNEEFKYVRILGAFYMRLVGRPIDIYQYLEPLYNDYRKVRVRHTMSWEIKNVDMIIDDLLREESCFDITLPRLPRRLALEKAGHLKARVSVLEEDWEEEEAAAQAAEEAAAIKRALIEAEKAAEIAAKEEERKKAEDERKLTENSSDKTREHRRHDRDDLKNEKQKDRARSPIRPQSNQKNQSTVETKDRKKRNDSRERNRDQCRSSERVYQKKRDSTIKNDIRRNDENKNYRYRSKSRERKMDSRERDYRKHRRSRSYSKENSKNRKSETERYISDINHRSNSSEMKRKSRQHRRKRSISKSQDRNFNTKHRIRQRDLSYSRDRNGARRTDSDYAGSKRRQDYKKSPSASPNRHIRKSRRYSVSSSRSGSNQVPAYRKEKSRKRKNSSDSSIEHGEISTRKTKRADLSSEERLARDVSVLTTNSKEASKPKRPKLFKKDEGKSKNDPTNAGENKFPVGSIEYWNAERAKLGLKPLKS